jgi:TonB family protein
VSNHSSLPLPARFLALLAAPLLAAPSVLRAEWRCDCTTVVGSCSAQISVAEDGVEIATDRRECARVDYFIDGLPFVALVVDGSARENWLTRSADPKVLVQSCQVCRDNGPSEAAPPAAAQAGATGKLEPLIEVAPSYPLAAQKSGLDGHVEVEFVVNAAGEVENARVVTAEPRGIFDAAALSAVSRWRYPADAARAPQTLTRRIDFNFADYIWRLPARAPLTTQTADSRGALSQCVREGARYDFQEMIEVSLISTCDTPLAVFGCAEGSGADRGRWVCASSDSSRTLLIRAGDPRLGQGTMVPTETGMQTRKYSDGLFLARAPNSQLWWIACAASDATCNDTARQWSRSLAGQLAGVDPRGRSEIALARSN